MGFQATHRSVHRVTGHPQTSARLWEARCGKGMFRRGAARVTRHTPGAGVESGPSEGQLWVKDPMTVADVAVVGMGKGTMRIAATAA
jgi:hypothetical protein